MAKQRFINGIECKNLLAEMAEKQIGLTLTNRSANVWRVYKSQMISVRANQLVLAQPVPDAGECPMEPVGGQEVAISFKKGYNKFLFLTRVIKADHYTMDTGETIAVLNVYTPDHIEKIQRRAYKRADVPEGEPITVTFWRSAEEGEERKRWQGQLANLSAGGLAMNVAANSVPQFEDNEQLTVRFTPLEKQKAVCVDARFRHATDADGKGMQMMGLQFIGLDASEEGRTALRRISRAVGVFQRQRPLVEQERD